MFRGTGEAQPSERAALSPDGDSAAQGLKVRDGKMRTSTTLRLGPLYVGSGSILSALLSKSKQADIHVGFHIGILKNKKEKTLFLGT